MIKVINRKEVTLSVGKERRVQWDSATPNNIFLYSPTGSCVVIVQDELDELLTGLTELQNYIKENQEQTSE
jgi:ABC-type phosphonate transport system ATPase subunit